MFQKIEKSVKDVLNYNGIENEKVVESVSIFIYNNKRSIDINYIADNIQLSNIIHLNKFYDIGVCRNIAYEILDRVTPM